eukprot:m.144437 g.144437  ORF g.144437 m.144437 type:complete len:250 (-) comp13223_c0_seq6:2801-3550(-)
MRAFASLFRLTFLLVFCCCLVYSSPPQLAQTFQSLGAQMTDARVIVDRQSGESRGFGFVDFISEDECVKFVEQSTESIEMMGRVLLLDYSEPRRDEGGDWLCTSCGEHNFKKRSKCYRCNVVRDPNAREVPMNMGEVVASANQTLIVRGLTQRTTEEMVFSAFNMIHPPVSVRLMREKHTNISRGFAFIDYSNVETATHVLNTVMQSPEPFQIDTVNGPVFSVAMHIMCVLPCLFVLTSFSYSASFLSQ